MGRRGQAYAIVGSVRRLRQSIWRVMCSHCKNWNSVFWGVRSRLRNVRLEAAGLHGAHLLQILKMSRQ